MICRTHHLNALLVLTVAALAAAQPLCAQTVAGRVVDPDADTALSRVHLRLLDRTGASAASTYSARTGVFHLTAPRSGTWRLTADLLGYGTVTSEPLDLPAGDTVTVRVSMVIEPLQIADPVVVTSGRPQMNPDLAEFERRRRSGERSGFGHFIYGEDLEHRGGARATDLLRGVPGVTVSGNGGFGQGQVIRMRGGCVPAIFLNGSRINYPTARGRYAPVESLDTYVDVESIEGIEVYRGSMQPGGRFVDRSGCGVVLVWTKRGEYDPDAPFSWIKLLVGLGLAGALFLVGG
jgi:hypothetical protein